MIDRAKNEIQFSYKNLNGDIRKCTLTPLARKDAMLVFHETLMTLVQTIVGNNKDGLDIDNIIRTLSFDKIWLLAEKLLVNAMIDHTEIKDINDTDYFNDKPDELYIVIFNAIKENYPDFFTRLKDLTKNGFKGLEAVKGLM